MVGGKPGKVLAQVESIRSGMLAHDHFTFAGFCSKFQEGLAPLGVAAGEVTATFHSVGVKEFAMNGAPLD